MDINKKKIELSTKILSSEDEKLIRLIDSIINNESETIKKTEDFIDGNCFTLTEFSKYLSNNHSKNSGAPFSAHEAKEFAKRGKLPDKYGGNILEYIEIVGTGIKYIRILKNNL